MQTSSKNLMMQRRFLPFFLTQFSTAFTDNLFKAFLTLLVTFKAAEYTTMAPAMVINIAAGLFILPFVLFSGIAGQLADKYDKAAIMRNIKLVEIFIMLLAAVGFYFQSLPTLLACLFAMGTHSAFFGPAKYACLPQVLADDELMAGNGYLEMGTFLAILAGTLFAGLMVEASNAALVASCVLLACASVGALFSKWIPVIPAPNPGLKFEFNPITQLLAIARQVKDVKIAWLSLLGISWFWFFGAVLLSQLPVLTKDYLNGSAQVVSVLLGIFSVGVAIGSVSCSKLSRNTIDPRMVAVGFAGLSMFSLKLYLALTGFDAPLTQLSVTVAIASSSFWRVAVDLGSIGLFGGLLVVPLYALVQSRIAANIQSQTMALNNVLNAVFMVTSVGYALTAISLGFETADLIAGLALLNTVAGIYLLVREPEFRLGRLKTQKASATT